FDEIEKAHSDVFNVLLQILDDGRLTDGQGRTVDFRNTVLIMTSNLGGQLIQEMSNRPFDEVKDAVMAVLRDHFRPEFLNGVDDVIVFQPLTQEHLGAIVDIQLPRLQTRLAERTISLLVPPAEREALIERGWVPPRARRRSSRTTCGRCPVASTGPNPGSAGSRTEPRHKALPGRWCRPPGGWGARR